MSYANPAANLYRQPRPRKIELGGHEIISPADGELLAAGWLPEVDDPLAPGQRLGAAIVDAELARYPAVDIPIKELAQQAVDAAYAASVTQCEAIAGKYGYHEAARWTKTEREAREYLDGGEPSPWLLAASTGDLPLYAQSIVANADAYELALGQILGVRKVKLDAIQSAVDTGDRAALLAIIASG